MNNVIAAEHTILNMKYCDYLCPVSLAELCIAERELDFAVRMISYDVFDVTEILENNILQIAI
jgi:hypothetical protein